MSEQDALDVIETLAEECCRELFRAYDVELTPLDATGPVCEEVAMTGVIGFTGPGIWGMCLLAGTNEPLAASNPAHGEGSSMRDWLAELVNQLAGRLKHKLMARGATVYITTPIVLQGARIEPIPRTKLRQHQSMAAGGRISLWVEVETAKDFVFSEDAVEESAAEGEAFLF